MSDQSKLGLGQIITGEQSRDAIHIAVAPLECGDCKAWPGVHVGVRDGKFSEEIKPHVGIVDPFLEKAVYAEQKAWIYLYPGSITSLRHQWSHPAFDEATEPVVAPQEPLQKEKEEAERWLRDYCQTQNPYGLSFEEFLAELIQREIYYRGRDCHGLYDVEDVEKLQKYASVYFGRPIHIDGSWSFSCSC